eukprot:1158321-Pelagomonas_calceolata.AAC.4
MLLVKASDQCASKRMLLADKLKQVSMAAPVRARGKTAYAWCRTASYNQCALRRTCTALSYRSPWYEQGEA